MLMNLTKLHVTAAEVDGISRIVDSLMKKQEEHNDLVQEFR